MAGRIAAYLRQNAVAFLALFIALGGVGAYAADTIGSSDVIDDSLLSADIHDATLRNIDLAPETIGSGRIANGTLGSVDVKDESLTGDDVNESTLARVPDSTRLAGRSVTQVLNALPDTLPPRETVRGTFGSRHVGAASTQVGTLGSQGISWGLPLTGGPPTPHLIAGGAAPPSGCSGDVANPGADPGHLCVFEGFSFNAIDPFLCNEATPGCLTPYGTVILTQAAGDGLWDSWGTWAVTGR